MDENSSNRLGKKKPDGQLRSRVEPDPRLVQMHALACSRFDPIACPSLDPSTLQPDSHDYLEVAAQTKTRPMTRRQSRPVHRLEAHMSTRVAACAEPLLVQSLRAA
ncbi:hypothetical protein SDJN03_25823, partial [Cucurbita argyrosperma subsp. sororia]